jgi:hypothetical protein
VRLWNAIARTADLVLRGVARKGTRGVCLLDRVQIRADVVDPRAQVTEIGR